MCNTRAIAESSSIDQGVIPRWRRLNARNRFACHSTTTAVYIADVDNTQVAALTPWTWAAGDVIEIARTDEAAS